MAISHEQRAGLWRAKLRALARDRLGRVDGIDYPAPWGAALETNGVWTALVEVSPERSFGQVLVLVARNNAESLDLLVSSDAAAVARRAQLFEPAPSVWRVEGTDLVVAEPSIADQVDAAPLEPSIHELLQIDDVDIVIEHGSIIAECRGLEVGRVTGSGSQQRLDVGVGAYDQGAFAVMHADLTPTDALGEVVRQVLQYRRRGGEPHPINRLARERWLRWELVQDPSPLGLESLEVVEPMSAREGIRDVAIASAVGTTADGQRVLVACSVGIDLDAVPAAADLAERHQADRIVIVLPERDRYPFVEAVAAQSVRPVAFVSAMEPWNEPVPS